MRQLKKFNIFSPIFFLKKWREKEEVGQWPGGKFKNQTRHGLVSYPELPKPHFHASNSWRKMICVVMSGGSLVWSQTDTEKPLKSMTAVENSLLEENLISLAVPSSWPRFRTLGWWSFGCPQKNLLSKLSLIWALKHFILWWVYLRRSWYFSLISDVWGLLHSCWNLKLIFLVLYELF